MIYTILKFLIRCSAELFYSKHKIINFDNLEVDKPLIICANHSAAHLDGILIMIFGKRRFHVLVRADIFKKAWLAKLLAKINLVPIYRMKDGFKNLDKNNVTFDQCYEILKNKGAIIIFPEANCVLERKLRTMHKGAAKIAFMAEERADFKLDIQMCALGICQERLQAPGGRLYLEAGSLVPLSDYVDGYKENPNKAYTELTGRIEKDLRSLLPVIEQREDEKLFEELIVRLDIRDDYAAWKNLAKSINTTDVELKEALSTAIKDFEQHLAERRLNMATVVKLNSFSPLKRYFNLLLHFIDVLAMFPFFLLGFTFNYLPYRLPVIISHKIFKKEKEYINGSHIVLAVLLFLIFYTFYAILLYFMAVPDTLSVFILMLIIALCGIVSYHYTRRFSNFIKAISFELSTKRMKNKWKEQSQLLMSVLSNA